MNDETTNYEDPNNQTVIKVNLLDNPNITEEERKIILDDPLVKQYITPTQEEIDDAIDKLGSLDDPNLDNFTKIKIMNNPRLQRITAAKNE